MREIERLIAEGHLRVTPAGVDDSPAFLEKARQFLHSAGHLASTAPGLAFLLSFSAVRSALLGVMARRSIGLTETCRDRSDFDNDSVIITAATELTSAGRFPHLREFQEAYEDRDCGSTVGSPPIDVPRWVEAAGTIVATADGAGLEADLR